MTDSLASQGQGMKNPQKIIPKNIFFHLCYLADTKANYFFTELMYAKQTLCNIPKQFKI